MNYFICDNKTGLANIQYAATQYKFGLWKFLLLPETKKAKELRKWYTLQEIDEEKDVVYSCGEKACRVVFDDYQAKLSRYRRYRLDNRVGLSDPANRADFLKDLESGHFVGRLDGFPLARTWSLDIETNGLNPWAEDAKILSIAISMNADTYQIIEFKDLKDLYELTQPELIIGHNLKFDLVWLARFGFNIPNCAIYDTMVAEHLIDENRSKSLESLIFRYTRFPNYWATVNLNSLEEMDIKQVRVYNGWDTAATFKIWSLQKSLINNYNLFNMEMDKLKVLAQVELNGMKVDDILLEQKIREASSYVEKARNSIAQTVPGINPNSGKQVGKYLYEGLQLPAEYTDKGQYKTDNATLEHLQKSTDNPFLNNLVELRTFNKLLNTYYANIKILADHDLLLHGHFNQAQVVTGRLSSSGGINFQNIPARDSSSVESLFCSRYPKGRIVKIDYSQIELRLLADLSRDSRMMKAFEEGEDIHEATAKAVGISRQDAKTLNFKIVYGGGNREETEKWFAAYPQSRRWREERINDYHKRGYVTSPLGRRRSLGIVPREFKEKLHKERQAPNAITQGVASDLTMIALILITDKDYQVINTVHDSIILDCKSFDVFDENILRNICEVQVPKYVKEKFDYDIIVPLKVDISEARNWGECR